MVNQKTNEPNFTTSEFPQRMHDEIDNYLDKEKIDLNVLAEKCNIYRETIRDLMNGKNVSKNLIVLLCIVMQMSVNETEELLNCAGYNLNQNCNTDKAYVYFIENQIEIDKCIELIEEWNKKIKSPYKHDKIKNLYRKRKHFDA